MLVAPSASKSPITSTVPRERKRANSNSDGVFDTVERTDRQQALEAEFELAWIQQATRTVDAPQHRMQRRRQALLHVDVHDPAQDASTRGQANNFAASRGLRQIR